MISTRDLTDLPLIDALNRRMQEMAALESVFAIEYGTPRFEYHPRWDQHEQMAAVKTGSGDELFVHFTPRGCCILGFAHESAMSPYRTQPPQPWPGLFSSVPEELRGSLEEPAFDVDSTTFVVWRLASDDRWSTDDVEYPNDGYDDGSNDLLSNLILSPKDFGDWLEENYEVNVDLSVVESVFEHVPITSAQLAKLNSELPLKELRRAIIETGFPLQ
ncbi:hypothetical protein [Aporhodopirellula aestuarii]|uniref:Uncharacterized protein n=1 Tax=Aporhodopirellula aestuarii TaxID=2950107 RepID=A0ABT0U807_9BACT|nr:hypothetical protein [Aporhodopirellula aestuarii]MCM2372819.1 hypothetical protein [Aporhodopirellula aestuarii]